ncbi:MAG: SpoIIE family protein phosphatase [Burkholderiales bacterium]|nr:SpoIIE family protein phosphatase [Phycisphaerae bacterium]
MSTALVLIAIYTSRGIAEQLGSQIVAAANNSVSADVREYLGAAMRVSDQYARRLQDGQLSATNLAAWERPMYHDLATNPDVASICFANPAADSTWLLHAHGRMELGIVNGASRDKAVEYAVSADGTVDRRQPLRIYHYDATVRPWYQTALAADTPAWTPIYFWFQDQNSPLVTGTGYTRMIRDADHKLLGVVVIDVTLGAISRHLRKLPIASAAGGTVFIVDEQGLLVAASDDSSLTADPQKRISLAESGSTVARAISSLVARRITETEPAVSTPDQVMIGAHASRVQVTEIKPFPGIHWHIVTVLPEDSFLATAKVLRERAILLGIVAVLGGTLLGLVLSRRLSRPLMRLSDHVARVGAGDFSTRLDLGHASELRRLSDEVNRMATGLKHRLQLEQSIGVAREVQQSLLPTEIPAMKGLEVAACSKYCDSTGGDYYDFIECASFPCHKTLIAVGDVTGHGIGAAMMMSSARGAVRASCRGAPSLGHILTQVNNVLAGGSRNGMFMTLLLVFVDTDTGYAHWTNAGHDPAIVFDPATDSFQELSSGDMPLGIESDVVYREFSRKCAQPGTILLLGTDGIWEARNAAGEMFGKQRLREIVRAHHASSESISDGIKQAMQAFVGDAPLKDDVTFVVIRVGHLPVHNGAYLEREAASV